MANIFISYSRNDSAEALALTEKLRAEGFTVWIDQQGIGAATSWSGEIVDAIEGCSVFIVLLSRTSVASENVIREVTLAFENKRKIIPVEIETVELPRELKYHLAGIQRTSLDKVDSIVMAALAGGAVQGEVKVAPNNKIKNPPVLLPPKKSKRIPLGVWIGCSIIVIIGAVWIFLHQAQGNENTGDGFTEFVEPSWHKSGSKIPEANKLFERAMHAMDVGDSSHIDEGKKLLENAIAVDSNFALAYVNLAGTYSENDSVGRMMARKLVRKAMLINPELPAAYALSGAIALIDKDTAGAFEYAKKGIALSDSSSNMSWSVLRDCYLSKQDFIKAFEAEKAELRFSDRSIPEAATFYMGWIIRNEDSLANLYPSVWIEKWVKAYREMPQNMQLFYTIFLALDELGDPRLKDYLQAVIEKAATDPEVHIVLSFYYAIHHDKAKLLSSLEILKKKAMIPKPFIENSRFKEYKDDPEFQKYVRIAK